MNFVFKPLALELKHNCMGQKWYRQVDFLLNWQSRSASKIAFGALLANIVMIWLGVLKHAAGYSFFMLIGKLLIVSFQIIR